MYVYMYVYMCVCAHCLLTLIGRTIPQIHCACVYIQKHCVYMNICVSIPTENYPTNSLCMCIYTKALCMYMNICVSIRAHAMYMYIHTCTEMYIHTRANKSVYRKLSLARTHTLSHSHIHTYIHTCIHKNKLTHFRAR